jgi:hypothetical protein
MITAGEVARVIVAACRETGADPLAVASGEPNPPHYSPHREDYSISRARGYAAVALHQAAGISKTAAARLCGVNKVSQRTIVSLLLAHPPNWWLATALERVKAALLQPNIDVSDDELRALPAELIDELSPKAQQRAAHVKRDLDVSLAELARQRRNAPLGAIVTDEVLGRVTEEVSRHLSHKHISR